MICLYYALALVALAQISVSALTEREENRILMEILSKYADEQEMHKRKSELPSPDQFNNCPNQDTPFPCKQEKCISLKHICDGNWDCPDGYDEDESVCVAYQRFAVDDQFKFIKQQMGWMVPMFFKGVIKSRKDFETVAHYLSVSPTIDDFRRRVGMSREQGKSFEAALYAVRGNDMGTLEKMGMKPESWNDVKIVFDNLIASGFL